MTLSPRALCSAFALAVLGGACKSNDSLAGGKGALSAPSTVDFGNVFQGATAHQAVVLGNGGGSSLQLSPALSGNSQLSLPSSSSIEIGPGATADLQINLTATTLGAVAGQLALSGDANDTLPVTGTVLADLTCPAPGPCLQSSFDPNSGQCVSQQIDNGQTCDDGDPCTTQTVCSNGVCKGVPVNCDDQNVCTVDYCQPGVGCQHLDESPACNGTNACQVYFCDPQSGCGSSSASNGTPCASQEPCVNANVCLDGNCTGLPIPNGTPCVDPRDPCVTDATCQSGICDSPTADALQPGDILWQTVSAVYSDGDGGSTWSPTPDGGDGGLDPSLGWRAAAATDALGNLYLDDLQDTPDGGDFVSLDICGRERWRVPYPSSTQWTNGRHLLSGGVVFSVGSDQTIAGASQASGAILWVFDPTSVGQLPAGSTAFTIEDIALSDQSGVLYYTADWNYVDPQAGQQLGRLIGGLLRNGQSQFQTVLPATPFDGVYPNRFGYPLTVDENEYLFAAVNLSSDTADILSYDDRGNLRFTLPVARSGLNGLAENHGYFVEPVSLTAFDDNGNVIWSNTQPSSVVDANGHSPVISTDGHATILRNRHDLGYGTIESYDAYGNQVWLVGLQPGENAVSSHVLDSLGLIYFVTGNQRLLALQEADGTQAWELTLPTAAPVYSGVLALTPAGSLVASVTERLFGVFAGGNLSTAPWPRFRGGNDNASTPETPAQPAP